MPRGKFLTRLEAYHRPDLGQWKLTDDLIYTRACGDTLIVPAGVYTDLASTRNAPGFPSDGPWNQAAVGHDFLYCGRFVSRWIADTIFEEMLWAIPEVPRWKIPVMVAAVRLFGGPAWNRNSEAKINHTRNLAGIYLHGKRVLWSDGVLRFC